jgi:hypothetical protein
MPVGALIPGEASMVDDRTPIRDRIRSKANRYGRIRSPMLVAINAKGRHLDKFDVMDALFGRDAVRVPSSAHGELGEPQMTRIPDGVWRGPTGPRNTRVSGVLILSSLLPWTAAVTQPALYLNPWARYPLGDAFQELEIHRPVRGEMVPTAGRPIGAILGLPEGWPSASHS